MLARIIHLFLFGVLACFLAAFILAACQGHTTERTAARTIDDLIVDLSSDRFETREAATRTLKKRVEAIPALRKARKTTDLEVRRRLEDILLALGRKRALHSLSKAKELGKAGRAVEVADRLAFAARCGVGGEEGWESLTQFTAQLIACEDRSFEPGVCFRSPPQFPTGDFRLWAKEFKYKEVANRSIQMDTGKERDKPKDAKAIAARAFFRETGGTLLLRGEEISLTGCNPIFKLDGGMIAASGDVQLDGVHASVIVAGGNITNIVRCYCSILICDGDVNLLTMPSGNCLIIARGKVTSPYAHFNNGIVRSGHTIYLPNGKKIDIKEGTADPLPFVKFFELADVGLTAVDLPAPEKRRIEGVLLKNVAKKSPFAAGLRAGDVITAVEDKKTPTTGIFRRLLRRKLAECEPIITFTVRRSGKMLDVPIAMKD